MYGGEANAQMAAAVMKAAASGLKDKCPAVAKGGDSPAFTFGVILEGEVAAGAARGAGLEVGLGMDQVIKMLSNTVGYRATSDVARVVFFNFFVLG
jgi:hypothetical protein